MASAHDPASPEPGISDLFRMLIDDTRRLMRDEIELAKSEAGEKARFLARQSISIAIGVVLGLLAAAALFAALTMGTAHALTPMIGRAFALWVAPLLIGIIAGGIGAALVLRGIKRLRATSLAPEKTIDALRDTGRLVADRFKSA